MASEINKVVFSDFDGTIEVIDERIKIESSNIREIARYKVYQ